MGVEVSEPEKGCCGLAGSFGFEAGHYDVSKAIGEQRLLPAVRGMGGERLIANGFSCQTQIAQGAGRMPRHLAEVIAEALPDRDGEAAADGADHSTRNAILKGAVVAAGAALAGGLLLRALSRRSGTTTGGDL
jgi:hypothetical protein